VTEEVGFREEVSYEDVVESCRRRSRVVLPPGGPGPGAADACLGRLYFPVPGGIQYGQHWLNVKFANSVVRVPFRILTEEESKILDKNYADIEKQVEQGFKKKS
jgi:hypothetical protein